MSTKKVEIINKPSLERLALVAGATRIGGTFYPAARAVLSGISQELIKVCLTYMEHGRRSTLQFDDLLHGVEHMGKKFYATPKADFTLCKNSKNIKKKTDCLYIGRTHFKNLVKKNIGGLYDRPVRMSVDFFDNLQFFVEQEAIKRIISAVRLAEQKGKVTLAAEDLAFVVQNDCKATGSPNRMRSPAKKVKKVAKKAKSPSPKKRTTKRKSSTKKTVKRVAKKL